MKNEYAANLISPSEANETSGLVILSVGTPEKSYWASLIKIQKFGKSYSETPVAYLPVNDYWHESEFSDHHGLLYVIKLVPGRYYVTHHTPRRWAPYHRKADFELHAKEIIYLGEIHMAPSNMEFRDQEARDLSLLKTTNPAFGNVKIEKRLLRFTGHADVWLFPE